MSESGLTKIFGCLIVAVVFLFAAGVFLATGVADRDRAAQERRFAQEEHEVKMVALREQIELGLQRARQLSPVQTAAAGMGLMAGAFTVMGLGFYAVAEARKRSRLIWPDRAGMFPQVIVELPNGARAFHDPNRSPTHVTVYEPIQGGGVRIAPVVLPGLEDSVRQAAAVQLTRAAVHQGRPLTEEARDVARRLLPAGRPAEEVGGAQEAEGRKVPRIAGGG